MYGPTLRILRQYGDLSDSITSCGVDTCAISLWKFLGVNVPCGVALATREFIDASFNHVNVYEGYSTNLLDRFVLNQTRSGIAAASALHIMKRFEIDKHYEVLRKLVDYDIDMAKKVEEDLLTIYSREEVKRSYFNVIFPKKYISQHIYDRYMLMRVGSDKYQVICLQNVRPALIDEFISEIKSNKLVEDQQNLK